MNLPGRDRTSRTSEPREGTPVKSLEKHHGKTRSPGLGTDSRNDDQRTRTVRFFRDRRGTDHDCHADLVFVHSDGSDAAGDDDVQWRHWAVVCPER
jgi:hypothetical protein